MIKLWWLIRVRVLEVTRVRATMVFFFVVPLVMLVAVGLVFANGHPFERRRVAVVSASPEAVVRALRGFPEAVPVEYPDEASARHWLGTRTVDAVVLSRDEGTVIETGPRGVLFARGLATALPGARIERVAVPRWGYVHYLLPGLIAFTVMISGLFGMSHPLLKYREVQFLKKLSLAPLSRVTFVLAQVLARSALSFGQMALVLAAAWWLFDLPLDLGRAAAMLAVVFLGLTVFMAVGFALACVLPTEAAMTDVVGAVTTPMVLLSEMFFPSSELPPPLRAVAVWLPSTQMVRMGRSLLLDAAPTAHTLAPCAAVLLAWLVVCTLAGVRFFRWND